MKLKKEVGSNHCYKSKDDVDHTLAITLANQCNHYLQSIINTYKTDTKILSLLWQENQR